MAESMSRRVLWMTSASSRWSVYVPRGWQNRKDATRSCLLSAFFACRAFQSLRAIGIALSFPKRASLFSECAKPVHRKCKQFCCRSPLDPNASSRSGVCPPSDSRPTRERDDPSSLNRVWHAPAKLHDNSIDDSSSYLSLQGLYIQLLNNSTVYHCSLPCGSYLSLPSSLTCAHTRYRPYNPGAEFSMVEGIIDECL